VFFRSIHSEERIDRRKGGAPGEFDFPTLCLKGRRSIQLSYGCTAESVSKAFAAQTDALFDGLTCYATGRRST
jgi:hypothetical protein